MRIPLLHGVSARSHAQREARVDKGLSALLAIQCVTLFVAIPLGVGHATGRLMMDACHLGFAAVCVAILTTHRALQFTLLGAVAVLAAGPVFDARLTGLFGLGEETVNEAVTLIAFGFNAIVTGLVIRHVFGAGRVTAHRVQGAVLLYLNVAALFGIAYSTLESYVPGAIVPTAGGLLTAATRWSSLTYFSLVTITTTGYGDLLPVHPLARSLASLEAVIGQLFPATLLARLVALHMAHESDES